ncbi:hypothetical protein [Winogradskyella sp. A2]|uniref:hypothetical protein n=1 Tax=Winogradskyella sp. A2 TaxID=3366944 RepID=UPI00398C3667
MKIINNSLILVLTGIIMSSCTARLKVEVSAANRDAVVQKVEDDLKEQIPTVIQNIRYDYEKGKLINQDYFEFLDDYLTDASSEKEAVNDMFNEIEGKIKITENLYAENDNLGALNQATELQNQLLIFYDKVENFLSNNSTDKEKEIERMESINNKDDSQNKELESLKSSKLKYDIFNEKVTKTKESVNSTKQASNRLRFHLLGDPLTSFVTDDTNKNKIWKSTFNQTKVSTFMGDTDIAVLLRKNPEENSSKSGDYNNNFTIKGVRLDAEDVIEASFKALSQSINLFASIQLAGTNLTSNNNDTSFAQLPTGVNNALKSLNDNKNKLQEKERYLNEIKAMLLEKIILEDVNNKSGDDFNESLNEISEYWGKLKTELNKVKTN